MKTILLLLLTIIATSSIAQSRENKTSVQFNHKSIKLQEAIGWAQNKQNGQWYQNKNVIDAGKSPKRSHIPQNFKWVQFATISSDSIQYYVLLFERLDGSYQYPRIKEGWTSHKRIDFFILSPFQYEEIKKHIEQKSGKDLMISSQMTGHITDILKMAGGQYAYNDENLLFKITKAIEKPEKVETCFPINSQTADGQNIVRFKLPEYCNFNSNLSTEYFEVKTTVFQSILID